MGQTAVQTLAHQRLDQRPPRRLSFVVLDESAKIADIVFLARRAHEESRFSYITFAPEKVEAIAKRALADPNRHAALMCRDGAAPVGFLYASVGEYHIGTGTLMTTVHNLNVLSEVRHTLKGGRVSLGLLKGLDRWSRARGASEVLFHVTSDVETGRTHKFIRRLGYKLIGGSYAKSLT